MTTTAPIKRTVKDYKSDYHNDWCPGCLAPNTPIVTRSGMKPISEIRVGDDVLAHDGRFHSVTELMSHQHDAPLNRLTVKCFGTVLLTEDHPVYAVRRQRRRRLNQSFSPEWIPARDVRPGDYVAYPVPQETGEGQSFAVEFERRLKDTRSKALPKALAYDDAFLRLAGFYIAEGHSHRREIAFTYGGHEMSIAEETRDLVRSVLELDATIKPREGKGSIEVHVSSSYLAEIFAAQFGAGAAEKRIPAAMLTLPLARQRALLGGLWAGDGTIGVKRAKYRTISPVLAEQVKLLLLRQGIVPSMTTEAAKGIHRRSFSVEVLSGRDYNTLARVLGRPERDLSRRPPMVLAEGFAFLPVRKNEVIAYSGTVNNFEVADAHSYVTNVGALHNCGDFGILSSLQMSFAQLKLEPDKVAVFSGIGCSGKTPHYLKTYGFHTLHGRVLTVATGGRLVNNGVTVVALGGDGDGYGIGAGYFVNTGRRNLDFAYIVHNNGVYGLTKGQSSPTMSIGKKTKSMSEKAIQDGINPIGLAVASGYTFIARGYALDPKNLSKIITAAIEHKGSALVDVLQTCPTYNDLYTKEWYEGDDLPDKRSRLYSLEEAGYDGVVKDPTNLDEVIAKKAQAVAKSYEVEPIPIGIYYKIDLPTYEERLAERMPEYGKTPLVEQDTFHRDITPLIEEMR